MTQTLGESIPTLPPSSFGDVAGQTVDLPYATLVDHPESTNGGDYAANAKELGRTGLSDEQVDFAWLEITGKCQEACDHCYAESSPEGTHGTMETADWMRAIDELSERGTRMVQFIGGEPTLHPDLTDLIGHALGKNMQVEVYSNLAHVTDAHWKSFRQPGVRLATSYYSADPATHREITRSNTHSPIRKNIQKATEAGIELRVGVIGVQPNQDISGAIADLVALGVDPTRIGTDHLRQVGRGIRDEVTPETTSQLCGNCADRVVAIMPDGRVQPCVFSRQPDFTIGNVLEGSIPDILGSDQFIATRGLLRGVFDERRSTEHQRELPNCSPEACNPNYSCNPDKEDACQPDVWTKDCNPNCAPKYAFTGRQLAFSPESYAPELQ